MAETLFSWGRTASWGQPYSWGVPQSWGRSQSWGGPAALADPAVAAGLATTRDALLSKLLPAETAKLASTGLVKRWKPASDGLPEQDRAEALDRQAADVRAALLQFELLGGLQFKAGAVVKDDKGSGWARLSTASGKVLVQARRPALERFQMELDRVQALATLRSSRAAEVLTQIAPPYAYFAAVLNLQAGKHERTMELVQTCVSFASTVGQRFKLALAAPRPSDYSGQIQPMIEVPQHGSFPAGHAIEAHVTAGMLTALTGASQQQAGMLRTLADRIAENRIVAGVHFPVDCSFGRLIGDSLVGYLLAGCGQSTTWQGGSFDGRELKEDATTLDFQASKSTFDYGADDPVYASRPARSDTAPALPLLAQLWERAHAEWFEPEPQAKATTRSAPGGAAAS